MADNKPATNVDELLAKVRQSTANIAAHRAAMADVAAQVAAKAPQTQPKGGEGQ